MMIKEIKYMNWSVVRDSVKQYFYHTLIYEGEYNDGGKNEKGKEYSEKGELIF